MRVIEDASAASLHPFVQDCVEPGSLLHTDGWQGYSGLDQKGYQREVTVLKGRRKEASTLMPRVHRIAGLLKRWLLGTHQGAVAPQHLSYYLDEFTFRFNRRRSKSRGKLFFRLMQQAAATSPKTLRYLNRRHKIRNAGGTTGWGRVSQGDTQYSALLRLVFAIDSAFGTLARPPSFS